MDPITRAALLHQEADLILQAIGFLEILQPYGKITFTGSYFLDLMAYPDIDVEMPPLTQEQIFNVLGQFFEHPWVDKVELEKPNEPRLPGGIYFMLRIDHGDWGRPWKIDMWSLAPELVEAGAREMRRLKELITPAKREIILKYKVARLNAQGRTPMGSGWWIYKAVLEQGLREMGEIDAFLKRNGKQPRM